MTARALVDFVMVQVVPHNEAVANQFLLLLKGCERRFRPRHGRYPTNSASIPKGRIRGYPTLLVRRTIRRLRGDFVWGGEALEKVAKLTPGSGCAFAKALEAEGLIQASRHDGWAVVKRNQSHNGSQRAGSGFALHVRKSS
jgi:hypothetical protein